MELLEALVEDEPLLDAGLPYDRHEVQVKVHKLSLTACRILLGQAIYFGDRVLPLNNLVKYPLDYPLHLEAFLFYAELLVLLIESWEEPGRDKFG